MVITKTVSEERVESLKMLIEIIFVMEMVLCAFCRIVEAAVSISAVYNGNFRDECQSDDKKRQMFSKSFRNRVEYQGRNPRPTSNFKQFKVKWVAFVCECNLTEILYY